MTVATQVSKVLGLGNGSATVFSFDPVEIFATSQMQVTLLNEVTGVETPLSEGTGANAYAITPVGGTWPSAIPLTGSITYPEDEVTPIDSDTTLVMNRVIPITQSTDLENQSAYFPDILEGSLDYQIFVDQQLQEQMGRAILGAVSDAAGTLTLPPAAQRANQFLTFDANGNITVSGTLTDSVTVSGFWQTALTQSSFSDSGLLNDVLTTRGDILRAGVAGAEERLALGATGTVLSSDGTDAVWGTVGASSISANSITVAEMERAGTSGQVLTSNGAGADASWQDAGGAGAIGQMIHSMTTSTANITGTIPHDNTIPQNTEGSQLTTITITPQNASSTLLIEWVVHGSLSTNGTFCTSAIFVDTTANALTATSWEADSSAATGMGVGAYSLSAGSTRLVPTSCGPGRAAARSTSTRGQRVDLSSAQLGHTVASR
jgi:hypothetical protein